MFDATAGVAHANASASTRPKLSPPSAGVTDTFARSSSCVRVSFGTIPSTSIPDSSKPMRACSKPVLQRVGTDQPQPGAGRCVHLRPGAQQRRQALARVVAADEHDRMVAVRRVGLRRDEDAVRNDAIVAWNPPLRRLRRHRRDGDPSVDALHQEPPELQPLLHPAEVAVSMMRGDDRALRERERRDAHGRRHRLVQMHHVELFAREDRADAADAAR